jgi:hypothetical protein
MITFCIRNKKQTNKTNNKKKLWKQKKNLLTTLYFNQMNIQTTRGLNIHCKNASRTFKPTTVRMKVTLKIIKGVTFLFFAMKQKN